MKARLHINKLSSDKDGGATLDAEIVIMDDEGNVTGVAEAIKLSGETYNFNTHPKEIKKVESIIDFIASTADAG